MRIGMLRIPCTDLAEAERFYTEKLGLSRTFGSVQDGFIGYSLENAALMLEPAEAGEFQPGRYLGFTLVVEDIADFYDNRRALGVEFSGPPQAQFWWGSMTHVTDSSGNIFSIVQSRAAGPPARS